jgi:pimeloyl-ACP methyl ester carboxylesterase
MPDVTLTIPVAGGDVRAQDTGQGTPLVLLHPGWGVSSIWNPLLDLLDSPAGRYRCITYDTRGYGRSPAPTGPFTQLADLTAVLDHLDVKRAALVGHSIGGGTAISFALAHPDRVSALILLAPGLHDYPWPPYDPYGAEFERLFTAGNSDGLIALGLRTWAAAGQDAEQEAAAAAQIRVAVAAFFRQAAGRGATASRSGHNAGPGA